MSAPPSTAPEERLREGTLALDRYEVTGVLGEGGTGVVYSARDRRGDAEVALKVMHPHLATDPQVRGRFTREAAILARLEGPHVCRILEFGEVPRPSGGATLLCLALPRVHGRALDRLLEESGPLPEPRALALAREILEALEAAHGQGVIHRDLKPHNVIVDDEGHATVVDFGLSKIVSGASTGTTHLTSHNMVFGTPEYMSPEQARGDELDGRADLYACGVLLFEMLTGTLPFEGHTPLAVLTAHLTDPPPRPESRAQGLSPAASAVVLRALSKDPANRHPTAGAMRAALERAEVFPDEPEEVPEAAAATEVEEPPTTRRARDLSAPAQPPAASTTERSAAPRPPLASDPASRRSDPESRARRPTPSAPRVAPVDRPGRGWIVAWVLVVGASLAAGVALGLR